MDVTTTGPQFEMVALQVPFPEEFIYSNASAIGLTHMDLRLSFAEATQDRTVKAKVGIVMPVEHAALLCLNLLTLLTSFEKNTGPIRHPQWREFMANAQAEAKTTPVEGGVIAPPQQG